MKTPDQSARERIRELRKRHGWTQQDLADKLNRIGAQTDRAAVAKVELGKRGLSLDEALQYAYVLDVAPVHLIIPVDEEERLQISAKVLDFTPAHLRAWFRGQRPILLQNPRTYFAEAPTRELPDELRSWIESEEPS